MECQSLSYRIGIPGSRLSFGGVSRGPWGHSWDEHLPLTEFAYNNSYQVSIRMTPYEALYGRPCRSPVCWMEVGDRPSTGPDLIKDTSEKVDWIRKLKPLS